MTEITPDKFLTLSVEDRELADYTILYNISQKLTQIVAIMKEEA